MVQQQEKNMEHGNGKWHIRMKRPIAVGNENKNENDIVEGGDATAGVSHPSPAVRSGVISATFWPAEYLVCHEES